MVNAIIFSKDRACQLDLLLRSMKKFWLEWQMFPINILYTYSNKSYEEGYRKLKLFHPEFRYVKEIPGQFREQLIGLMDPTHKGTMFFVDDLFFKEGFTFRCDQIRRILRGDDIAAVALRLHPLINYCYTEKRRTDPPEKFEEFAWEWRNYKGDWGYPMSVDGNFFLTDDIFPLMKRLKYENPNTFEGTLANNPIDKPLMMCFPKSVVMNMPINKVQTANGNHCGNVKSDYLNEKFLHNFRISLSELSHFNNISAHQEIRIKFEDAAMYRLQKLSQMVKENAVDYSKIFSDALYIEEMRWDGDEPDISFFVPVKGRVRFLKPLVEYVRRSIAYTKKRVHIVVAENDAYPKFQEQCEKLGVSYIYVPLSASYSKGLFAKSLMYNICYMRSPRAKYSIFHDLDILVERDYFKKLEAYLKPEPIWVQPYTKRRVMRLSGHITDQICSGKVVDLSVLRLPHASPSNPGSTGGSIVIRSDMFEKVGGYDPELFYGYAPEDSFIWTKLETLVKPLDHINDCFQGGAVYADDPPIEVYHMEHLSTENQNKKHNDMRDMLGAFWIYRSREKDEFVELKRSLIGVK